MQAAAAAVAASVVPRKDAGGEELHAGLGQARLTAVAQATQVDVFASGDGGVVIASGDAGVTWRAVRNASTPEEMMSPSWPGNAQIPTNSSSEDEAFTALEEALQRGVSTQQLAQGLVLAACETMRRFRIELDADPSCQDDWLNITHALTTCVAGFEFARFAEPEASFFQLQSIHQLAI